MSPAFSEAEIAEFKESFAAFDRNGDGAINAGELRSLLKLVGEKHDHAVVAEAMSQFDTNNDKHIDFDEFLRLAATLIKNKSPSP
ncbi:hypothetical protein BGZ99_000829 [Dissophora globulifera]|uniref:EF-hand domain-containing protein n=1 Tax=Dissophora globulifera TaxID=979702 RepID=A0A9P6QZT9_9FUNG|nr:hypothetical protein BGZ99_000829 [Dissophora globulifera]